MLVDSTVPTFVGIYKMVSNYMSLYAQRNKFVASNKTQCFCQLCLLDIQCLALFPPSDNVLKIG